MQHNQRVSLIELAGVVSTALSASEKNPLWLSIELAVSTDELGVMLREPTVAHAPKLIQAVGLLTRFRVVEDPYVILTDPSA